MAGEEHDITAAGADLAEILDGGRGGTGEIGGVGSAGNIVGELAIRNIERGSEETAGLDDATTADEGAIRIDKPDGAVGVESAVDDGGIETDDAVQGSASLRLNKGGGFAEADGEAVPVDDGGLAGLVDDEIIADHGGHLDDACLELKSSGVCPNSARWNETEAGGYEQTDFANGFFHGLRQVNLT